MSKLVDQIQRPHAREVGRAFVASLDLACENLACAEDARGREEQRVALNRIWLVPSLVAKTASSAR